MSPVPHPWFRGLAATGLIAALTFLTACGGEEPGASERAATPIAHTHAAGETCYICDPTKRDTGRLWCTEHGRYEDRCWLCQPQLEDPDRPYCEEHFLYEDECHLCNPALREGAATPSNETGASAAPALFCNEHGVPELECGICQPQLAGTLAPGESLSIRMPSARSAELAGLTVERPGRGTATASLQLLGEVRYNENRRASVTPLAAGVLTDIRVDVGESVEAGQVLAVVNSAAVAQAKSAYLSALAQLDVRASAHEREQRLAEENIAARRDVQEAQGAHRLAVLAVSQTRQQLLNLGFTEQDVETIEDTQSANSDLLIRAPFAGTVIERSAALGEAVDSEALFAIADLSTMWIELAVPEDQAIHLVKGGAVSAHVRARPGQPIDGEITWISPQIDEQTRMVRGRAVVPNTDGILRHGMFTEVTAIVGNPTESLQVPTESVHQLDGATFLFVRNEPDLYALRRVEVGPRSASGAASILAGLDPNESVVIGGSFTMRTEFLKSRLGAGCVDD
jgi:cobalt-zinc-cadmium efflux system membrane fusion protein